MHIPIKIIKRHKKEVTKCEKFIPNKCFLIYFKFIYCLVGISLKSPKILPARIMFLIFITRILFTFSYEMYLTIATNVKMLEFFANICFFIVPITEFTYLYISFDKLNKNFNQYGENLSFNPGEYKKFINSFRKVQLSCMALILFQYSINFSIGVAVFQLDNSWIVRKIIPVKTNINPVIEKTLGLSSYAFESFTVNYIPLSISLYLCCFRMMLFFKESALKKVFSSNHQSLGFDLNKLDDLIDSFEAIMSVMPFNWLAYCLSTGIWTILIFLTPNATLGMNYSERQIAIVYQSINILMVLATLFVISKWQENMDETVKSFTRIFEDRIYSVHFRLIDRINEVLKRKVTVWLICPIDRSLIMTYIGSTITFSTLFMQFQQNST